LAALAALLVAGLAGTALAWRHAGDKKRDVELPRNHASPAAVVRSYLRALDARDCETVAVVWSRYLSVDCTGVKSVHDIEIEEPSPRPGDDTLETYVQAKFTITWRWLHTNPSLNGRISWGYYLSRDTPRAPWRIDRGGAG
jgi:hypothetical protein